MLHTAHCLKQTFVNHHKMVKRILGEFWVNFETNFSEQIFKETGGKKRERRNGREETEEKKRERRYKREETREKKRERRNGREKTREKKQE